jgi:hypothetical protein
MRKVHSASAAQSGSAVQATTLGGDWNTTNASGTLAERQVSEMAVRPLVFSAGVATVML